MVNLAYLKEETNVVALGSTSKQSETSDGSSFQSVRLSPDVVKTWGYPRVRYEINKIYATYGAEFPQPDLQTWANKQPWYKEIPGLSLEQAELMFNEEDKYNIELLAARRTQIAK